MKNNIIIFGSNGYIGKHLAHELMVQGYSNIILTDINEASLIPGVPYIQSHTGNFPDELITAIHSSEYIFYMSGLTGTIRSIDQYDDYIKVNEIGLLNLLMILKGNNRKCKLIFPSTRLVYKGKQNKPLREEDEKEFKTIYALNKFSVEQYLKIFKDCYDIRFSVFRICVPYGNTVDDTMSFGTIAHFINKAKAGENVIIFGDGSQKRTLTHITDVVKILVSAGTIPETDNDVFNIGGPDHLSIAEVAKKIAGLYSVRVDFKEWTEMDRKIESGDTLFDSSKLNAIVAYKYLYNFDSWILQNKNNQVK